MTARIYLRVSSADQALKFSLDAQRERATAWCEYQRITEYRVYPDAGISGRTDDRPALQQLLRDLQAGDVVVVYALSRLGRGGAVQMLGIINQIKTAGARLYSLTENVDTETSAGRLMLTILAALAELEVEQMHERTAAGRNEAARQGIYPHSSDSLPTGWARDENGRITEDEHASTVRFIFQQGTAPYERTAKHLTDLRIPTPRGGAWEVGQVRRIVQFDGYWRGVLEYGRTTRPTDPESWIAIPAPALVTRDVWQAAQRTARTNHRHTRPDTFPLTGHLLCACGSRLMGRDSTLNAPPTHNRKRGYTCYARVRKAPTCPTNNRATRNYYSAESIAAQAREALAAYLTDPTDPAHVNVTTGGNTPEDPHARERADVERRLSLLTRMQLDGAIEYADYLTLRGELLTQRERIPPTPIPIRPDTVSLPDIAATVRECTNEELAELLDLLEAVFQMTPDGRDVKLVSVTPFPA